MDVGEGRVEDGSLGQAGSRLKRRGLAANKTAAIP
jgi:hypothetical protein